MAVIGPTNFAVVLDAYNPKRVSGKKTAEGLLTLTGGADTYAIGGVTLIAKEKFGFIREMTSLILTEQGSPANSYKSEYVKASHKLQLFEEEAVAAGGPLLEAAAGVLVAPTTRTWRFVARGW